MTIFDRPHPTPTPNGTVRDVDEMPERLRACEDRLLVLSGEDGTNGRLGNLTTRVDTIWGIVKWIGGGLGATALTAALAIYGSGQKDGARTQESQYQRAKLEEQDARIKELERVIRELRGARAPLWPTTGDDR